MLHTATRCCQLPATIRPLPSLLTHTECQCQYYLRRHMVVISRTVGCHLSVVVTTTRLAACESNGSARCVMLSCQTEPLGKGWVARSVCNPGFLQVREKWKKSGNLCGQVKVRKKYRLQPNITVEDYSRLENLRLPFNVQKLEVFQLQEWGLPSDPPTRASVVCILLH